MARIAFLGLGQMWAPMAARLLHAGRHLTVWDRTTENTTPLVQQGATAARSPAEAAAGADLAITSRAAGTAGTPSVGPACRRERYTRGLVET